MRKIIIRSEIPGYTDIEIELEKWLKEKISTEKVRVIRDSELPHVVTFKIEFIPENKERISPEDFNKLMAKIKGQSLEDALGQALADMLDEAKKLPDDGNPF